MTDRRYRIAPIFAVRPAGVPFDVVERLHTPGVPEAARRIAVLESEAAAAAAAALEALPTRGLPGSIRSKIAKKLLKRLDISQELLAAHPWLAPYHAAYHAHRAAAAELDGVIDREYHAIQDELVRAAARELPDLLVIEAEGVADELERLADAGDGETADNSSHRRRHRTLALYLQRVCAKNDTISRFGPITWGSVVPGDGVRITARAITKRAVEVERWVVRGLIAAINGDPQSRAEVCPRLHPHGRFEDSQFVRLDQDRAIALDETEHAIALRCDGNTPAHALGDPGVLGRLVEAGVVRWELEPMAVDASPLASLRSDLASWRPGSLRDHWLAAVDEIAALARSFEEDPSTDNRQAVLERLRVRLGELGIHAPDNKRTLYAARNPLNENCYQDTTITLGERTLAAVTDEVAPWFDLYADSAALAAMRAFERLRAVIDHVPMRGGVLEYSALVRVAQQHGLRIDADAWLLPIAIETFREIRRMFTAQLAGDEAEWRIGATECHVVRRQHRLPSGGELLLPSADFQVAAPTLEDAAAGRCHWLVSELHFGFALMQHSSYWCCPDKGALHRAMAEVMDGRPLCVRDSFSEAPVHICGEPVMTALPRAIYAGTGRPKPGWRVVRPADAEVVVRDDLHDIRLRARGTGEDLGSIVWLPRLLMGLHPFFPLERAPHEPRTLVGDVVVQRQSWHLTSEALGETRPNGVSAAFVRALERERAARGIPRRVFVRPVPGALRSDVNFSRDKDLKPLYIDLESVVFLDVLERRLRKYGTLAFVEMLPTPDQIVWQQPGGRVAFELRTNIVREP